MGGSRNEEAWAMANPDERLQRLEEAIGFSDHSTAQVSDEVRELGRLVAAMAKRLERLESRLETMARDDAADDGPAGV
jgi:uncharacterized coiled-coil protein SlyX